MERNEILKIVGKIWAESPENRLAEDLVPHPELAGKQLYAAPLVGFGAAKDPLFAAYKDPGIIGPWFMTPEEWLPGAASVISLFFPFTDEVKKSIRENKDGFSSQWIYGRAEGQAFLTAFTDRLQKWFAERGIAACAPRTDPRFAAAYSGNKFREYGCVTEQTFSSNWSERHAAFVCGLGTFGLSSGLITEKGMAGRLTSLILSERVEADVRPYTEVYESCIKCGACVRRCPAKAIDPGCGKDSAACKAWQEQMIALHGPRFGCGLCQTRIPCESRNPGRKK